MKEPSKTSHSEIDTEETVDKFTASTSATQKRVSSGQQDSNTHVQRKKFDSHQKASKPTSKTAAKSTTRQPRQRTPANAKPTPQKPVQNIKSASKPRAIESNPESDSRSSPQTILDKAEAKKPEQPTGQNDNAQPASDGAAADNTLQSIPEDEAIVAPAISPTQATSSVGLAETNGDDSDDKLQWAEPSAEPVDSREDREVTDDKLQWIEPSPEPQEAEPGYTQPPLENKYLNKELLRDRLLLRKVFKPIIAYVGRLDFQKGVNLIRHGIFYALENGGQFVLLGVSPDPSTNDHFWHLKRHLNDNPDCHLEIGFDEELSHLVYAGSDMIIMPSLYEPCGLAQMIALKYGAVPIVRSIGGLADTVFDRDYSSKPMHERNGYVFHQADAKGLESAMRRAIGLWYDYPNEFRQLLINGMKYDYSWNYPGQHYLNIYEYIRCK